MQKSSEIASPILDVIRKRRSRRTFADTMVESDQIQSLFEAARWAPSSLNEQPWFYIYATRGQELWNRIFESLNESNKVWTKNAPLLICSLLRRNFIRLQGPNPSAMYDVGAANAFLSLQAAHLGLNVRQMGGFRRDVLVQNLGIPEDLYKPVIIMAIGYPGDIRDLPEHLQARESAPRERFVAEEFVMNKRFNE